MTDDPTYQLTEVGHTRLLLLQAREDVGAAWKIVDEQDERIHLMKKDIQTLQDIITDLSRRSGIVVISPARCKVK